MGQSDSRVLIIGAGPGGLATAIALGRIGVEAEIFERSSRHLSVGGGISLRSNAVKSLLRLGVGQPLVSSGVPYRSLYFYTAEGQLLNRSPEGEVADEWGPPSIAVLRSDLYQALITRVEPDVVHLEANFVSAEQDEQGVTAHFADGREERGALLLGCDGLGSVVRGYVLEDATPEYSGFTAWRTVLAYDPEIVPAGEGRVYIGRGKAVVMFPCAVGEMFAYFYALDAAGGSDPPGRSKETLLASFGDWAEPVRRAIDGLEEPKISRADIYERDPGPTWFKGRIALIGDSIHPTTPFYGQGASAAMEDGITLAKELALADDLRDGEELRAALEAYRARREDRVTFLVGAARRRGQMFSVTDPDAAAQRDLALSKVPVDVLREELRRVIFYD